MLLRLAWTLERVSLGSGVIAALLILPLVTAICVEVVSRYVFGAPTTWAYELGYMGMGAHFLLGAAYTLKVRGHIRIDLLYALYPEKVKAAFDLAGYSLLILPFCVWMTLGFWEYTVEAYEWGETSGASAWNPKIWPYRLTMMMGFTLLAIQLIAEILRCLAVLVGAAETLDDARGIKVDRNKGV
ncbi:TRAP-type mannitol/chloroaromatic compound transport system permease small subunit [Natronocella acetinitrilica]|uniref:TRAP transporter small permease protein n=1 Tax=Natronocella acetinitrilica TaxID=414046 RepID=A0AAE3G639_9GAMM|nr:TRAP transporter small permease subunit [Natronocella acetinitrilica]MCP1675734.1 TRAP-type mannitol/chloroaromatic compound transport system permease small subunit [Natronocella acetinitrilica]